MPGYHTCTDPNGLLCKLDTPFNITHFAIKSACSFGKTVLYPISHVQFFSFYTLSISEIYHITILRDFLIKYRPFKCNIDHKFKNINHLSKMVDYRPMVDNIDPLAALTIIKITRNKTVLNWNFLLYTWISPVFARNAPVFLPIFLQECAPMKN